MIDRCGACGCRCKRCDQTFGDKEGMACQRKNGCQRCGCHIEKSKAEHRSDYARLTGSGLEDYDVRDMELM